MTQSRRQHLIQTAAYLGAVLGVPALWRGSAEQAVGGEDGAGEELQRRPRKGWSLGHKKLRFDAKPREDLAAERPEFLFLGDSMAKAHIDPETVTRLTGRKGGVLFLPNSTSARWYLMLKNYVIPSGVKPRRLFVLFRNCLWHMPSFRVDGHHWDGLERAMEDTQDPVIKAILGLESRRGASPLSELLRDEVYPVQTHGDAMRRACWDRTLER
jgi:hypothetical protein